MIIYHFTNLLLRHFPIFPIALFPLVRFTVLSFFRLGYVATMPLIHFAILSFLRRPGRMPFYHLDLRRFIVLPFSPLQFWALDILPFYYLWA